MEGNNYSTQFAFITQENNSYSTHVLHPVMLKQRLEMEMVCSSQPTTEEVGDGA